MNDAEHQELLEIVQGTRCAKCRGTNLTANKKGFGVGKALAGGLTLGVAGLLAGFAGSGKVKVTCLKCGHSWTAGKQG